MHWQALFPIGWYHILDIGTMVPYQKLVLKYHQYGTKIPYKCGTTVP